MGDTTVQSVIEEVRDRENAVLRCTTPSGEHIDFAYVPMGGTDGGIWVRGETLNMESHTVSFATVENMARRCDPDNELLETDEYSNFGTGDNAEVSITTYDESVFPRIEPGP